MNTTVTEKTEARQGDWPHFEFVIAHDTGNSGPGFNVYAADVLAHSLYGGAGTVLDHVEVTLAPGEPGSPEAAVALYTAAAVAEEALAGNGWTVVDHITSYGSHGKGLLGRVS